MSSKGEILPKFWFRRFILAITILCASVWWASVATLAQDTVLSPSKMTACSILCSLDGPRSNRVPNLVSVWQSSGTLRRTVRFGTLDMKQRIPRLTQYRGQLAL
jgi:hypothetical protein